MIRFLNAHNRLYAWTWPGRTTDARFCRDDGRRHYALVYELLCRRSAFACRASNAPLLSRTVRAATASARRSFGTQM